MNSLFGLELPAAVNFVIAFAVVLALIAIATWAVKRFGGTRMEAAARGRQPRLAVVDSATVDGRRKLVIVRRDNVEHLLMIGGPTDVVVESSIVRGAAAVSREPSLPRETNGRGAEPTLPRAMPLPDTTSWPLAPEPASSPAPAEPVIERPRAESRIDEPRLEETQWPTPTEPVAGPASVRAPARAIEPAEFIDPPAPAADPRPARPAALRTAVAAAPDASLTEMAQRLEAALRRPMVQVEATKAPTARRVEPRAPLRPAARPAATVDRNNPSAAAQAKAEFENLEQEMASLLGRPSSGKT